MRVTGTIICNSHVGIKGYIVDSLIDLHSIFLPKKSKVPDFVTPCKRDIGAIHSIGFAFANALAYTIRKMFILVLYLRQNGVCKNTIEMRQT